MSLSSSTSDPARATPLQEGLAAARANLWPALLLQAFALSIVLAYYWHAPTRELLGKLEALRERYGLLFPAISTPIFAAVIPLALQSLQRGNRTKTTLAQLPFLLLLWSYKGIEFDLFYRLQAWLFGDAADLWTVVGKVLVDQFVYCPLWVAPTTIIPYAFKDAGYSWTGAWRLLGPNWIRRRLIPIMFSNWAVWLPAVAIIYCLPTALQLPMQNIVLCLWMLLFIFLVGREQPSSDILLDTDPP